MASQNNGQQPARREADDSLLAVLDANEFKQKYRLREILEAMTGIDEAVKRAKNLYAAGEIDVHGRRMLFHDAVKNAIWQCWTLLLDHNRKRLRQAKDDDHDGPEVSEYLIGSESKAGRLGVIEQAHDSDIVIRGLWDYFIVEEMWTERWTDKEKRRNVPAETVEREVQHSMPEEISWEAAFRLKEFLSGEHDLEVQFETMEKDVHADPF